MKTKLGRLILSICVGAVVSSSMPLFADVPNYHGKIILIVDNTMASDPDVGPKIQRLEGDLTSDGWRVLRHDVTRGPGPAAEDTTDQNAWSAQNGIQVRQVKAIIKADYDADPANVAAVLLLGHVAVPYSGDTPGNDGGHSEFDGAQPMDPFYGDTILGYGPGGWTDSLVDNSAGHGSDWSGFSTRLELRNVPGDGKFDPDGPSILVQLAVGRVDLYNMPIFGVPETTLISRYLEKDHDFRWGNIPVSRRGLFGNIFGAGAPSFDIDSIVGSQNVAIDLAAHMHWFPKFTQPDTTYLVGYGAGNGGATFCYFVGATGPNEGDVNSCDSCTSEAENNFVNFDSPVVFTSFYGSFFGIWDQQDDFLKAPLANPYDPANGRRGYGLICTWAGGGLNSGGFVLGDYFGQGDHNDQTIMGDVSLRLHPVLPATDLIITQSQTGIKLTWTASADSSVTKYNIFSAPTSSGPWTLMNSSPVQATTYTPVRPVSPNAPDNFYMVRAIKLESTPSGNYVNMSEGTVSEIPVSLITPYLQILGGPVDQIVVNYSSTVNYSAAFTVDAAGCDSTGNGQLTYQWYKNGVAITAPPANVSGATTSTLVISDVQPSDNGELYSVVVTDNSGTMTATSSSAKLSVWNPPSANNDTFTTTRNTPINLTVLNNDTSPNGGAHLSVLKVTGIPNGMSAVISSDKTSIQFNPGLTFLGTVTLGYVMSDGAGTAIGTVTVNVNANAATPTISSISSQTMNENSVISIPITVGDNFSDPNDLVVTATSSSQSLILDAGLSVSGAGANRTLNVQQIPSTTGTATITVHVTDLDNVSTSTSFTVTVVQPNVPILISSSLTDQAYQFNLLGPANSTVQLSWSDDLISWKPAGSVTLDGSGAGTFEDLSVGPLVTHRFYTGENANGCSVDTVGFVKVTVPGKNPDGTGGLALIANPLFNPAGNDLNIVLANVPINTAISPWNPSEGMYNPQLTFASDPPGAIWTDSSFNPVTVFMDPGEGFNINNFSAASFEIAFTGSVPQGQHLNTSIPSAQSQISLTSSIIPFSGTLDSVNFPAVIGDQIFQWNSASNNSTPIISTFTANGWDPAPPTLRYGEAFFITSGASGARTWTENYSGCLPQVSQGTSYTVTVPGRTSATEGGYALIANQLNNPLGNTLGVLLPRVPSGTTIYKITPGNSSPSLVATFSGTAWDNPNVTLNPGEAAFINNPQVTPSGQDPLNSSATLTLTFSGSELTSPQSIGLPAGIGTFLLSSVLPQSDGLAVQGFPGTDDDSLLTWNKAIQGYDPALSFNVEDGLGWIDANFIPVAPSIAVGEGFVINSTFSGNRTWVQNCVDCTTLPQLSAGAFSGNNFGFTITGDAGSEVEVEATQDFVNWTILGKVTLAGGTYNFTDTSTGTLSYRFYSVRKDRITSVNTLGFVKVTIPGKTSSTAGGFALIANQLNNPMGNTLGVLLPSVPSGTTIYKLTSQSSSSPSVVATFSGTAWDNPNVTLNPGESAFINNPQITPSGQDPMNSSATLVLTFIGSQVGMSQPLSIPAGPGNFLISSILPVANASALQGFPGDDNDSLLTWNKVTQGYNPAYSYDATDDVGWVDDNFNPTVPVVGVGEGFFLSGSFTGSRTWTQSLPVAPP